jgi:gliding motility-associated-like protein
MVSKYILFNIRLFVVFLMFFIVPESYATHIVGGEITYRCLGNNNYEITLRVFRDCDTGVPWFDNPASIGVFDINNVLVYDLRLLMRANDTLDLDLNDPCLVAPPNLCIHTTSYVDTVNLPFRAGGYQLVYQRCCRNVDIVNIVNPLNAGATYYALITEQALQTCNSSAVFNEWPPVYICLNRPILFDHSATDVDGDSLVYEMCTPLDGATPFNPMPQPPLNPPYLPVTWIPGFSANNMLGGPDSLRINSSTGLLQGTPSLMGVFVVGICVREYRNGVLISTTRRDFQYAIGICGELVSSAFFAPVIQCDNSLLVQFQNNSSSLGTGYQWSFGDSTTNATSNLENPIYIYPDTGSYVVTLIADPGSQCADTTTRTINLQYESIIMDFDVSVLECSDTTRLQIIDLSVDTISDIIRWNWNFGNGQTSNVPFASTFYTQSGTYPISLTVEAANGCSQTLVDTITLNVPNISSADTVAICAGESDIVLNPGGNPNHTYQWSPATGLSSTTDASPIANPTVSTTYNVTVTALNGIDSCFLYKTVTVLIAPPLSIQPIPDTITCNDTLFITANTVGATTIEWAFNSAFNPLFSTQNPAMILLPFSPSGEDIFVRIRDAYGCEATDEFKVNRVNIPINPDFSFSFQGCNDELSVQFTDLTTDFSQGPIQYWYWEFGDGNTTMQQNPLHNYNFNGPFIVKFSVMSSQGCVGIVSDTIEAFELPILNSADSVGICQGQTSVVLNPGGNSSLTYQWAPASGLSATNIPSPIANPTAPTLYTVTITSVNSSFNCINVDSVFVGFPPPITVDVPDAVYCGSQVTLTANSSTAVSYEWAGNSSFFIILATGNPVTLTPVTFPFSGFYVRATDAYGCTATDFALVQQTNTGVAVSFTDSVINCSDTIRIQFNNTTAIPSGTTISSIVWNVFGPQNFSSTQQNPIFNFVRGGVYTIQLNITLSNGCSGSIVQVIDLNVPTIIGGSTVGLCPGQTSVTLNPGGDNTGITYLWSPATGLNDPFAASPVASPPNFPFTYTVTITANNYFGVCQSVKEVTVVQAPPVTMSLVSDTTFCDPRHIVYGTPTMGIVRWEWSTDPNFSFFFLINVNPVQINFGTTPFTYTLYIRAYDQYGCTSVDTGVYRFITDTIPVNAMALPMGCDDDSLVVQFTDLTVPIGGSINQYIWNFGNGNSSNAANPQFVYGASDTTHIYSLFVRQTNGCTGIFTDSILYQLPNFASNDSLGLCGDFSPVVLNEGGNPNLIYEWAPSTGLSSTSVASPLLTPSSNITYTVTITAPNQGDTCVAVHEFTVFADDFELNLTDDTLICSNRIALYVNNPSVTELTWALDPNFTLILGLGNPFITNVNTDRMFYVRGRNAFGCEAYDSIFVRVKNSPIDVNFSMDAVYCGDSLIIDFSDQTVDTLDNPIVSWNWNFGDGNSSTLQHPTHNYLQSGNYNVSLTVNSINGCNGEQSQPLNIQLPSFNPAADTIISCNGDAVSLYPNADTSLSYSWSPTTGLDDPLSPNPSASLSSSQLYTVTVSGIIQLGNNPPDSCLIISNIMVIVPETIILDAGADSSFCTQDVLLNAAVGNAQSLEWSDNPNFSNIISQNASFSLIQNSAEQTYYIRAIDPFGCSVTDSVILSQNSFNATINSSAVACPNDPARLTVVTDNPIFTYSYNWSPDSLISSGQGSPAVETSPEFDASFNVIVSNEYGCVDTLYATVTVSGTIPNVDALAEPDTVFLGNSVQLTTTENSTYVYSWQADPSLSAVNIFNPLAVPIQPTMYRLTVTDAFGCSNTDSVFVFTKNFICEEPFVFVPNTFTPNADGSNDILYVRGNVITELYFAIYNRWGELVFETSDQNIGWDGTFKGRQLSPDVYGYYLRYKCIGQNIDDKPIFKKGNVTLIR